MSFRPRPPRFFRFAWHPSWHPTSHPDPTQPCILLIHGLMAGRHMQQHWLACLRDWGYQDVTLYSNHRSLGVLREHARVAAQQGRPIVLLGYSQGGFQALKLARLLAHDHIDVAMLVMIAAGGLGRFYPAQWRTEPRCVPSNVRYAAHFFAEHDRLGTDLRTRANHLYASGWATEILNHGFAAALQIDHFAISRAAPARPIADPVYQHVLLPLQQRLASLNNLQT